MKIDFIKYQGAGNDFVIIDDYQKENGLTILTEEQIAKLCDRHFGIGADGLIILRSHPDYDFEMVYYNSDGRRSSMCGNGGRCIVDLAARKGIVDPDDISFLAADGPHKAKVKGPLIELGMSDVQTIQSKEANAYFLDTGSPHYVSFVDTLEMDLYTDAHRIRYNEEYKEAGCNVNFVKILPDTLEIRTYERGVEGETLACGTGVTAAALAYDHHNSRSGDAFVSVRAVGGDLSVSFEREAGGWKNIWLIGPAEMVYFGQITLESIS